MKYKILEVISGPRVAALATAVEKPRVRYIVTVRFEDLSLRAATMRSSIKVSHILKNPNVSLTIWSGEGLKDVEEGKPLRNYRCACKHSR